METKTIFLVFFIITPLVSYAYPNLDQENVDDKPLINSSHVHIFDLVDATSRASQDYNDHMLENLPPKYQMYLQTCMDKMEPIGKCGLDVLKEILTNEHVPRKCCKKILRAGKKCYMEIQKIMFRLYQLKRFASRVSFRINHVWDRCSKVVENPSLSHHEAIELS
ncbi:protein DOWN-REGULATED IN DIF1 11-like [Raphanus sativus]|uniref:Protein DOWN-REGULATED IN DIF1 11-like n=1 Tax=Raphanus sativus TaxID=3726 RepID=A0A9W3C124_RAPSA|nr:protein DOWN-REGULATED IN DIF1 11-like [Raphanus sativus]